MPYSPPEASFLISSVPPTFAQLTDAGFAKPAVTCGVGEVVAAGVGVGTGGCCVQPAIQMQATRQNPKMSRMLFFDIMILSAEVRKARDKK